MIYRVIGVGSPYADDQVGWHVIGALEASLRQHTVMGQQICLHRASRPATELLPWLSGSAGAIVVDAMRSGAAAGTVRLFTGSEVLALSDAAPVACSHGFGLAAIIQLAEVLGDLPAKMAVCAIEAGDTAVQSVLTPQVAGAVPVAAAMVEATLREFLGRD